jgi:5'-phosphate synthase pdxT subunit
MVSPLHIGVLALQGAFREHRWSLERCGAEVTEIRLPLDNSDTLFKGLDRLDGLVLPGGESTVMGKLLQDWQLLDAVIACGKAGMPIYGSCAGLILLCRDIEGADGMLLDQPRIGLLHARVRRNAFGRQTESFETTLSVKDVAPDLAAVFIRAPFIVAHDSDVEVLACMEGSDRQYPVAVRQGNLLATAFHPELTHDLRFHSAFLSLCRTSRWKQHRER